MAHYNYAFIAFCLLIGSFNIGAYVVDNYRGWIGKIREQLRGQEDGPEFIE